MTEVKFEREELKMIMCEAMAASREDVLASTSARGGAAISAINDETGEVNGLAVKLSSFWTEDPESWFDRADSQFLVRGIKEDTTKFAYVVQALDFAQHKEVKALIRKLPREIAIRP